MKNTIYKKSGNLLVILLMFQNFNSISQNIACGGWHSLAVCNDSTVKGFGENATGQLGDGTTVDKSIPVTVNGLSSIIAVSAGGDQLEAHSMALKRNGTVWAWGSNLYGGLGNGNTTSSNAAAQVLALSNVKAISAGGWHSAALKNDGTVWVWGWNADGQIGDGTIVDKTIATQVPGLTGITKIACGTYHTLALKNDGTVWAWGDNVAGQIGDGTTTDRTTPYQISNLSNVVNICAGRFFSLAIKSDGTVWTWGENLYGQLGIGSVVNSSTPVQVNSLTNVNPTKAATGAFNCVVQKNDGTIWSWGRNTYGNLGDGTVTNKSTPAIVAGISNAESFAAGTNFTLLYKTNGTMWGCGRNTSGQLGDGTVTQQNLFNQSNVICPILQTVNLKENKLPLFSDVTVYPNPSNGNYTVKNLTTNLNSEEIKNLKISVFNIVGQKIYDTTISDNNNIIVNIENMPSGVYILQAQTGNKKLLQKLIKE